MKLQQLQSFVAVFEERSFTGAAQRANATQSGLSMQIKELEQALGATLFVRSRAGVEPTVAGERFYAHATRILRDVSTAERDLEGLSGRITGTATIGLMPTFTRPVLARTLIDFTARYPDVTVKVVEAYSARLVREVAVGALDFAVVPPGRIEPGVVSRHLASDRELFVTRPNSGRRHLMPTKLTQEGPLKLVLPGPDNTRRAKIDDYIKAYGLDVAEILEIDSMFGTLELIAHSDWTTIAPAILCYPDLDGRNRFLHPITEPAIPLDYLIVTSGTTVLSNAARLFEESLTSETRRLIADCHRRLSIGA